MEFRQSVNFCSYTLFLTRYKQSRKSNYGNSDFKNVYPTLMVKNSYQNYYCVKNLLNQYINVIFVDPNSNKF